jgi:methyl-accepting chemotaxis protein
MTQSKMIQARTENADALYGVQMKGIGLRQKLALGFGTLLTLLILTGSVGYYSTGRVIAAAEDVRVSLKRKEVATAVELSVRKQIQSATGYVFNGDDQSLQQHGEAKKEVNAELDELGKMLRTEKGKGLLEKIQQDTVRISAITDQEITFKRANRSYEANDLASGPKSQETLKTFGANCKELEEWEDKLAQDQLGVERQAEGLANAITLTLVGCGLLLGISIAFLIARSITASIMGMLETIQKIAEKDLAVEDVEVTSRDETGQAAIALNSMKNTLHRMVRNIAATAEHLASASEEISAGASQSVETARVQAGQAQQVAVAMQEMSSTVQHVSEHSLNASNSSAQAATAAKQGGEVVEQTLSTMRSIAESSRTVAARIGELGKSSEEIGKIVAVIDDLADQTNLLALNAAIEAARAGEQGRGFAVVADEVRKLAEHTTQATQGIGTMIQSIQTETRNAVQAIELGSRDVQIGVEKTTASGTALKEIIAMAEQVGDTIAQIASAATEQSSATEQVNMNVAQIASLTQGASSAAEETAKACAELSAMALDLQNLVNQFKLDDSRRHPDAEFSSSSARPVSHSATRSSALKRKAATAR